MHKDLYKNLIFIIIIYFWVIASLMFGKLYFFNKIYISFEQNPEEFYIAILFQCILLFTIFVRSFRGTVYLRILKSILLGAVLYIFTFFVFTFFPRSIWMEKVIGSQQEKTNKYMKLEFNNL